MLAPAPPRTASRANALVSGRRAPVFAAGYALAAAITALAISLAASPRGPDSLSDTSRIVLGLLSFNLLLIAGLAGVIGWRVMRLIAARREPGARLHLRFVAMFAVAAVTPAVVVALFFGLLVTRGIDSWFSERVGTLVESYSVVGKDLADEQADDFTNVMFGMTDALNQVAPTLESSPLRMSGFLTELAGQQELIAAYLIDSEGTVLGRAESFGAPPYLAPPAEELRKARRGDRPAADPFPSADLLRAVYPLEGFSDVFLSVAWPEDGEILERLAAASAAVVSYREAERNRSRVQIVFALSYIETALLVLVGAVWVGMSAATRIAAPVARLVQAADRVAGGDLSAQVETEGDAEEIAVLSHAFNRMTHDLNTQQEALRAAGEDAESRRRFIETVLSRVSAGVIGLDEAGRISAANQQALTLLGMVQRQAVGQPLREVAPELAGVAGRAAQSGHDVEEDVDLTRHGETRRLRARASAADEAGLVITFDDITRLVTAQRNAAWRDVARRIAHEIKNPLTPIQLSAERIRRKYRGEITSDLETFDRCTDTIIRQVGDIGRMVDEFSGFARMPAPKFAREDAAELLRQAVFAQRVATPDLQIDLEEPGRPAPLVADGRMVGQALTNILKNAAEAVEGRVEAEPAHRGHILVRLTVDPKAVTFEVEDNGVGLPARDRDRLTEPYVTKREKGTGLGLAIVKRILEDHGGALLLGDSTELGGAKICLQFRGDQAVPAEISVDAEMA
jgi:two-component system nitrogen regulation sensor histidine kinase NtrY